MMAPSKQPPTVHNKYYFLKVNIKDYYNGKFQVYIKFIVGRRGKFIPPG